MPTTRSTFNNCLLKTNNKILCWTIVFWRPTTTYANTWLSRCVAGKTCIIKDSQTMFGNLLKHMKKNNENWISLFCLLNNNFGFMMSQYDSKNGHRCGGLDANLLGENFLYTYIWKNSASKLLPWSNAFWPGLTPFGPPMWQAEADTELTLSASPTTAVGQKVLALAKRRYSTVLIS